MRRWDAEACSRGVPALQPRITAAWQGPLQITLHRSNHSVGAICVEQLIMGRIRQMILPNIRTFWIVAGKDWSLPMPGLGRFPRSALFYTKKKSRGLPTVTRCRKVAQKGRHWMKGQVTLEHVLSPGICFNTTTDLIVPTNNNPLPISPSKFFASAA